MKFTYSTFLDIVFVSMLVLLITSMVKLIVFPVDQEVFAFVFGVFAIVYLALRLSGKSSK